ncbi:MAG: MFS transporter [Spirochaetes bacterium]|nr:MFS transporter [Spirochaetota bacterium]
MIKNKTYISIFTFLSLGLLGLTFAFVGASLSAMKAFFLLDIRRAGMITAILQLGFAPFCLFGGILADFFRKDRILSIGTLILGIATMLIGRSGSFGLHLAILAVMGVGCGFLFVGSNTLVVDLFSEKRGTFLNILHFVFAVGSLVGPLIMGSLLSRGQRWQTAYRYEAAVALFIAAIFFTTNAGEWRTVTKKRLSELWNMIMGKKFILLMLTGFFAIGLQFSIMYLTVIYLQEAKGLSISYASLALSVYYILLGTGRLICSALVVRVSQWKLILFLLVSLAVFLIAGWALKGGQAAVAFSLTGLSSSGLMPILLSLTSSVLDSRFRGTALGFLAMCGGLGGMAITYCATALSKQIGLENGILLIVVLSLFTVLLYAATLKWMKKNEEKNA